MAEWTLAIIVLAAVGVAGWRVYDRYRADRLARLRALAADFYPQAHAMLSDPRITFRTMEYVMVAASAVENNAEAWAWVLTMTKSRFGLLKARGAPVAEPKGDPEFERACIRVMIAGLFFLAELKPIPGVFIRQETKRLQRHLDREPAEVPVAPRRWIDNDGHPLAA